MQLEENANTHCLNASVLLQDLHLSDAEAQTESAVESALQKYALSPTHQASKPYISAHMWPVSCFRHVQIPLKNLA